MRRQATDSDKIFARGLSDKGLLSKPYKELLKSNNKKMNNLVKKWTKNLNRRPIEEDTRMAHKNVKRCSISYVIREMQIEQ